MSQDHQLITTAVEAVARLVQLLTPLSPEERERALSAAFILMGQPLGQQARGASTSAQVPVLPAAPSAPPPHSATPGLSPKAETWLTKNQLTIEQLEHVFSIDASGIEVIAAHLPGKSKRQQTYQSYLLCGLKSFLLTGEMGFVDKDAREICGKVGCYDSPNHSNYMKAFGNAISGSKDVGWRITNPGLVEAAKVVKSLSPTNDA